VQQRLSIFIRIGFTLQVVKTALATGLSWLIASQILPSRYPYFAALGAILTVQVTVADSIQKAIQRVIGIIGGVIISLMIGRWLAIGAGSITFVVLVGMAISTALRLNQQITSQVAVSSLLVLAFGNLHGYAIARIFESIIGSVIAIVINAVVVPPNAIPAAETKLLELKQEAADVLRNLAVTWMDGNLQAGLSSLKLLVAHTENSVQAVKLAEESIKYSPFLRNRRKRLKELAEAMSRFEHITVQIRGIARGIADLGNEWKGNTSLVYAMDATAECIELFGRTIVDDSRELQTQLQSAITKAKTIQTLCLSELQRTESLTVLRDTGAILTDLNRILKEVSGETLVMTGYELRVDEGNYSLSDLVLK
jgi:uncharacterized membrane protein YgaE (UPF0421/DUF939 family)